MNTITTPWMAELVLISWRSVRKNSRPPLPSELLASFIVFGTVGVVSASQPKVGSIFGWGIVIATALNLFGTSDFLTSPSLGHTAAFAKTSGAADNTNVTGPVAKRTTGGK